MNRHHRDPDDALWSFATTNFRIDCYAEPEEMDPADSFAFEDDIEAVRSGAVDWFGVAVIVTGPNGEQLGSDYLGGCAYTNAGDFVTGHREGGPENRNCLATKARNVVICHYFPDMVRAAIAEARANFAKLGAVQLRKVA